MILHFLFISRSTSDHTQINRKDVFFCNKSRLLRGMCIISTSVSNMTVLQRNETSHEIGLSIERCRLILCKIIANNVFVNHQIKFVEGNISLSSWSVLISKVLV